jgi:hypothetical protein
MSSQAVVIPQGAFTQEASDKLLGGNFTLISVSGAIPPRTAGRSLITKAGVAALTLAAPSTADDGLRKVLISTTAQAHTITATGLFQDGAGHVNLATFAAQIGASIHLMALSGKWVVLSVQGVTMS